MRLNFIIAVFISLLTIKLINAYPSLLGCVRNIQHGSIIMGNPAILIPNSNPISHHVNIFRNGVPLSDGNQYVPGEVLEIEVDSIVTTTGLFKWIFEVSGGAYFLTGNMPAGCNNRAYNLGDGTLGRVQVKMPSTPNTAVIFHMGWAQQFGHVYVSENTTLINFPSTTRPTLSPAYKSVSPSKQPTRSPVISNRPVSVSGPGLIPVPPPTPNSVVKYTLILRRQVLPGSLGKSLITINGTTPGPTIRLNVGQTVQVTVINQMGGELGTTHWHGFDQVNSQWNDGPPGVTQCPINTISSATNTFLSPLSTVTSLVYTFTPEKEGTYWYHGHFAEQYVDGLYGAMVVEDSATTTNAYTANAVSYVKETELLLADWYTSPSAKLQNAYLSPSSFGNEPVPDAIVVNNQFSQTMAIAVSRQEKIRIRVVNAAAMSTYTVSVDGMPLTVIEVDGNPVKPKDFASVTLNVGQRASFILDWSRLDSTVISLPAITFRVKVDPKNYRQYNFLDTVAYGLYGSTSGVKFNTRWKGQFQFIGEASIATYNSGIYYAYENLALAIPKINFPVPKDINMLELQPLFPKLPPKKDLIMWYNISMQADSTGVVRSYINGQTYAQDNPFRPTLYEYMSASGGPLNELATYPYGSTITGDGVNPFVLPFNRTIDVKIVNHDGGHHPIHLHGHSFYVMATSDSTGYITTTPIKRDVVSIPALGWAVIRFVATNPGVWLIHCHNDWHMGGGMMAKMIEAPSKLKGTIGNIPADHKQACASMWAPTAAPVISNAPVTFKSQTPSSNPITSKPSAALIKASFTSNDWSQYGGNVQRTGLSPYQGIASDTLTGFKLLWTFQAAGVVLTQPLIVLNYDINGARRLEEDMESEDSPVRRNLQSLPYNSLGCYGDKASRTNVLLGTAMTSIAQCYAIAVAGNYRYFALGAGKNCYGANSLSAATQFGTCPTSTGSVVACACTMKCSNKLDICGGNWALSLYEIVSVGSSPVSVSPTVSPNTRTPTNAPSALPLIITSVTTSSPSVSPVTSITTSSPSVSPVTSVTTSSPSVSPSVSSVSSVTTTSPSQTPVTTLTSLYNYVGCYGDKASRTNVKLGTTMMSVSQCYDLAVLGSYKYFGLEAGKDCYGSNSLTAATVFGLCPSSTGSLIACKCSMTCGNKLDICGGSWALSLYEIVTVSAPSVQPSTTPVIASVIKPSASPSQTPVSLPTITPSNVPLFITTAAPTSPTSKPTSAPTKAAYSSIGCYGDRSSRTNVKLATPVVSIAQCYALAVAGNYQYFGVESGKDCWASNSLSGATQFGSCPTSTGSVVACTCTKLCSNGIDVCGGTWALSLYAINSFMTTVTSSITSTLTNSATPTTTPVSTTFTTTTAPVVTTLKTTVSPTLAPTVRSLSSHDIAYVGDEMGNMYAMDLPTGSVIWQTNIGYTIGCGKIAGPTPQTSYWGITSTPAFDRSKNALYSMGGDGTFYALNMRNGAVLWSIPMAYDPVTYVSYSALLLYNDIIYAPMAFHCDQFLGTKGPIIAISAVTKSVLNTWYASGDAIGGGMWGMGGPAMSIGLTPATTYLYIDTGNCGSQGTYNYCESIARIDANANHVSFYKPPKNPTKADNDFGSSITVFNHPSEGQTSGCKTTLVAAAKKDATLYITDDQTNLIQVINVGDPTANNAYMAGPGWDPYSNILMIGNAIAWTDITTGTLYDKGIHGFKLGSNCQLTRAWFAPMPIAGADFLGGAAIVGPPGRRFMVRGEKSITAIDIQTGAIITSIAGSMGPAPPSVAGGYVVSSSKSGSKFSAYSMF